MTDKTGYWEDGGGNRRYGHYYVSKTVEMGLYHPWREEKAGTEISLQDIETEPDCDSYERQPIEEGEQDIVFEIDGFSGVLSGWFVTNGNRIILRDEWNPTSVPKSVDKFKLSDFEYDP